MSEGVIDASSVLVLLKNEPGAQVVRDRLSAGTHYLSTVNQAEILSRLSDLGLNNADAIEAFSEIGLNLVPFSESHAQSAAALRAASRPSGLSLGDRACLALALELQLPVLTADRTWLALDLPISVVLTR